MQTLAEVLTEIEVMRVEMETLKRQYAEADEVLIQQIETCRSSLVLIRQGNMLLEKRLKSAVEMRESVMEIMATNDSEGEEWKAR